MGKVAGRKKRIIGTTVALVAIGGGAAFAYWTASGAGDTTASAGNSTNFTVTASVTGAALTPGGAAQTATFVITNPGTGVQKVQSVVATVANTNGSPWSLPAGCSAEDFLVGNPVFTPTELAANGSLTGTVTLQMVNREDVNQNGCKGATVPLHFVAS